METHHDLAVEPQEVAGGPLAFLLLLGEMTLAKPAAWLSRPGWRRRSFGHPLMGLASRLVNGFFDRFLSLAPPSVVAIIRQGSRLLFIDRVDGKGLGLPGGIVFPGESYAACLAREVREETGLSVVSATEVCRVRAARYYQVDVSGELRDSWEGRPVWLDRSAITQAQNIWVHDEVIPYLAALAAGPAAGLSSPAATGTKAQAAAG